MVYAGAEVHSRHFCTKFHTDFEASTWSRKSFTIIHATTDFSLCNVTVCTGRLGHIPGARVTWNTTVPPECVASVTVEFKTSISGSVVRSYTTTNTSETEIIQTGLQCATTSSDNYLSTPIWAATK